MDFILNWDKLDFNLISSLDYKKKPPQNLMSLELIIDFLILFISHEVYELIATKWLEKPSETVQVLLVSNFQHCHLEDLKGASVCV